MPLSEHEQRMLDEIERALYHDDPKFATSVDVSRIRRRRPILAAAAFIAGLVLLVVGVRRRWQALVVVPAGTVALVAFSQLAPWAVGLPRWSSLGAAGVLLLAVGVRYEARRRNVRAAARWVRSLG